MKKKNPQSKQDRVYWKKKKGVTPLPIYRLFNSFSVPAEEYFGVEGLRSEKYAENIS